MKTITLKQAISILENCSAVVIDNVVTYPNLEDGEDDDDLFLTLSWVDEDFNEFEESFYRGGNKKIQIVDSSMFIFNEEVEEVQLTILCPQNLENLIN
jgi:hypothetical protein